MTVSFRRPYTSRICSIFPLWMESKALVKSTNNIVKVLIVFWKLTCQSVLRFFDEKSLKFSLRACLPNAVVSATDHLSCSRYVFLKPSFLILFNSFSFSFSISFSLLPTPQNVRYSKGFWIESWRWSVRFGLFLEYDSFLCFQKMSLV